MDSIMNTIPSLEAKDRREVIGLIRGKLNR